MKINKKLFYFSNIICWIVSLTYLVLYYLTLLGLIPHFVDSTGGYWENPRKFIRNYNPLFFLPLFIVGFLNLFITIMYYKKKAKSSNSNIVIFWKKDVLIIILALFVFSFSVFLLIGGSNFEIPLF